MDPERDPEGVESQHLGKLGFNGRETVLEIGSGNGRLTWRLLPMVQSIIGIDVDGDMLQQAESVRSDIGIQDAHFMETSAEQLPLPDGSFEWVLLAWSL